MPDSGTFAFGTVLTSLQVGTIVSFNKTSLELTVETPDGSNILICGLVLTVDDTNKTATVGYLKATNSGGPAIANASYTPATDDAMTVLSGELVAPGTSGAYAVEGGALTTQYATEAKWYYKLISTISDIEELENYTV